MVDGRPTGRLTPLEAFKRGIWQIAEQDPAAARALLDELRTNPPAPTQEQSMWLDLDGEQAAALRRGEELTLEINGPRALEAGPGSNAPAPW